MDKISSSTPRNLPPLSNRLNQRTSLPLVAALASSAPLCATQCEPSHPFADTMSFILSSSSRLERPRKLADNAAFIEQRLRSGDAKAGINQGFHAAIELIHQVGAGGHHSGVEGKRCVAYNFVRFVKNTVRLPIMNTEPNVAPKETKNGTCVYRFMVVLALKSGNCCLSASATGAFGCGRRVRDGAAVVAVSAAGCHSPVVPAAGSRSQSSDTCA